MRLDTVTTKVYSFDELSEEAKKVALERFSDINVDFEWWNSLYEDWDIKLVAMGYDNAKIQFSGFYSQGDGASFTADVDLAKWLKAHKKLTQYRRLMPFITRYCQLTAKIERNTSHYVHENSIDAVMHDDIYESSDSIEKLYIELEKELDKDAHDLSQEIYQDLKKTYEYLTGEESVTETIIVNEYEFKENGEQY